MRIAIASVLLLASVLLTLCVGSSAVDLELKPRLNCRPTCRWECSDPSCPAECHAVCDAPKCDVQCEPTRCAGCKIKCRKPFCSIRCPQNWCEKKDCPKCEIVCTPTQCHSECATSEPTCMPVCEVPVCSNKCRKPDSCKQPKCRLVCEKPACEYKSEQSKCCPCDLKSIRLALEDVNGGVKYWSQANQPHESYVYQDIVYDQQGTQAAQTVVLKSLSDDDSSNEEPLNYWNNSFLEVAESETTGMYPSLLQVLDEMTHQSLIGKPHCCPCAPEVVEDINVLDHVTAPEGGRNVKLAKGPMDGARL